MSTPVRLAILCDHDLRDIMYMCTHMSCIMRSAYMQVVRSRMNLVRIPHRARMYLAYCMYDSRRDHDMKSRSPKLMMRRNRS